MKCRCLVFGGARLNEEGDEVVVVVEEEAEGRREKWGEVKGGLMGLRGLLC